MEVKKILGLLLLIVGLVSILINILVIYPSISCGFAPWTFWLIALIAIIAGVILFFNLNLSFTEED
ncbi:MAG: hypothetical protein KGD72_11645 [Candidatus Lokiarchaeota archaeon]|nr:hypothetical protein [Candidatus Lokiarchaeota archaeon]